MEVISGLPEAEVDRTLVAAQRHGGSCGLKPGELLHQVPEIGCAGVQQRRRRLTGSSRAPSRLGVGVVLASVGQGCGIGGAAVVVELSAPLIAGNRHC